MRATPAGRGLQGFVATLATSSLEHLWVCCLDLWECTIATELEYVPSDNSSQFLDHFLAWLATQQRCP